MGVNSCHWSVDVRNICLFVCLFLTLTKSFDVLSNATNTSPNPLTLIILIHPLPFSQLALELKHMLRTKTHDTTTNTQTNSEYRAVKTLLYLNALSSPNALHPSIASPSTQSDDLHSDPTRYRVPPQNTTDFQTIRWIQGISPISAPTA